jgi:hypothetical protein
MSFFKKLFGGSSGHSPSQGLTLSKNSMMGFLKDNNGTVRGFWFPDQQKATDVMMLKAAIAMCGTKGETVEQSDYVACCAGLCSVKPAEGGYLVVFPSARF